MQDGNIYDPRNITHPYLDFVGYLDPNKDKTCCGSAFLVSKNAILTAYHCIKNCKSRYIRFYNDDLYEISEEKIFGNDLALCYLSKPVKGIRPIGIYSGSIVVGEDIVIAGWNISSFDQSKLVWGTGNVLSCKQELTWGGQPISKGNSGGVILVHRNSYLYTCGIITGLPSNGTTFLEYQKLLPENGKPIACDSFQKNIVELNSLRSRHKYLYDTDASISSREIDKWLLSRAE